MWLTLKEKRRGEGGAAALEDIVAVQVEGATDFGSVKFAAKNAKNQQKD